MKPEQLRQYLAFYRDLGIQTLYRQQAPSPERMSASGRSESSSGNDSRRQPSPGVTSPEPAQPQETMSLGLAPTLAPGDDTLAKIREDLGDCTRCRLHEGRNKLVFGGGNEKAKLVFVGEGPGADEDAQGIPFVGRAGKLLTQMIENTARKEGIPLLRKDVYICNVIKCRPPDNRTPQPDEMKACSEFLFRQLLAIRPKAIVALGGTAAKELLRKREGVTRLRGKWYRWQEIPLMVTYHPSYLLRPYNKNAKHEAWEDLKKVFHFVYD